MRPAPKQMLLALMAGSVTGSAQASVVQPAVISPAVRICVQATSKSGVDDQSFIREAWTPEIVPGLPGDRFYSKGDLRASLGTRPNVGGSCIISFNTRSPYDLEPLTRELELTFDVKALAGNETFAMIPLAAQLIMARVTPIPNGSVVSVAVEMSY